MPLYEIHHETYHPQPIPVVEAKDAYEAAIQYAARWAPCSIRRIDPDIPGDKFEVNAIGTTGGGIELEVFAK